MKITDVKSFIVPFRRNVSIVRVETDAGTYGLGEAGCYSREHAQEGVVRHFREFLVPYHKRMFDRFHEYDMPVIYHSDGDIRILLDDLIDAGVDAINPLEAKAGMDVRELAPRYGDRLAFVGNIDVRAMLTNDPDVVREEIRSKLAAVMPHNGFIYHSDHSVPPGVSLDTYRLLLDEVRRIGVYE